MTVTTRWPATKTPAFTYEALPMRVVFGVGAAARIAEELDVLSYDRVLVLCSPEQLEVAEQISVRLGHRSVGVHPGATMHVPVASADAAVTVAKRHGADACVAVGGGSTTGLGKAVTLRHGLPVVAVPTTYAGSEMTPIWGITDQGVKTTGRNRSVLPRSVVYDPELTLTLPVDLSVTSGLNAMAHAIEGLWATDASPVVSLMAGEGVRLLISALPRILEAPADVAARSDALRGAWLCGAVLGATTMSLHHQLCHLLGGGYDLPHAATHAVLLPQVLAFNAPSAPAAADTVAKAIGAASATDVAGQLWDLGRSWGAPTSLAELGLAERDVGDVVSRVLADPYANPRPVEATGLRELLIRALRGERP